jgi:glycolate dehydrogenase FAD-binding subunit
MTDTLKPRSAKDVEDAVQWALARGAALELVGRGTKRAIGRPAQSDLTLDLSGLAGVILYEPEELVLSARAGTPLEEIETLLAAQGQHLAFEPIDYGQLLAGAPTGATNASGTIGGVLAANLCGPRRISAGAARDHFLGFEAVSGRGESFKSGGRVVKNVTGYDVSKLMAGSWGTLAALTTVTIKVLPRPQSQSTVVVSGLDDAIAVRAMAAAMATPCDVSGAAHLPAMVAPRIGLGTAVGGSCTVLRLEGVAPSVEHRRATLIAAMKAFVKASGAVDLCDEDASRDLWRAIRDVTPFAGPDVSARPLWRIVTAPSRGAELVAMIAAMADAEVIYDWAGGLVWVMLASSDDAGAALVRRAVGACGGQAMLIRAPAATRAAVDVFSPQEPGLASLTRRVKQGFDPNGVLNPGRMWAGV